VTKVINIRSGDAYDIYIGRGRDPKSGILSPWGNPYSHQISSIARFHVNSRNEAIERYAQWLPNQRDLIERVCDLEGLTLGCWCEPQLCHGRILAALADGKIFREITPDQYIDGYRELVDSTDEYVRHEIRKYILLFKHSNGNYIVVNPE